MEFHEREFLVYRLVNGYIKYRQNSTILIIRYPTYDVLYDAQEEYRYCYDLAISEGIVTDSELYGILCELGIWDDRLEQKIDPDNSSSLYKQIEDEKVNTFNSAYNSFRVAEHKLRIRRLEQELLSLLNVRHSFDHCSAAGVAEYVKKKYILEHSTKNLDGSKYDWSDIPVANIIEFVNKNTTNDLTLRELSRTEPWSSIWNYSKKPFKNKALSDEQKRLIAWSQMYQNIHKSHECPPQDVIDDNDMIDGWLIIKRRERDKSTGNNLFGSVHKDGKVSNSQEVYYKVGSQRDAAKIYSMNDGYGKSVVESRKNLVNKKGSVPVEQLTDMKIRILEEMNKKDKNG